MSYTKGCYIGQEILSRIKTTGKMPREMIAWQSNSTQPIRNGASLSLAGKVIGTVTSQTLHPLSGNHVGLGFVRQGQATVDSELLVDDEVSSIPIVVKITALFNQ
jgi:folate-binding Fe-S cluster repair protein YgfZ